MSSGPLGSIPINNDAISDPQIGLRLIPEQASDYAGQIDQLYFALLTLSSVLVLTLAGLIVYFGFRYRAGNPAPRGKPVSARTSHRLEIAFALLLGMAFAILFVWAGRLYLKLYDNKQPATTINVLGKQWMWKIQHPDGVREINTLHVPVGEPIRLRLTSQDVIHSFSIPALRFKRDAVPGMYTYVQFIATRPGQYRLFCAEFCGTDHSRMRGMVVVLNPADYQQWLTNNGQNPKPSVAGEELFSGYGCRGCHMGNATVRAPDLTGLLGRAVPLAGGGTLIADEAYIRDSILRPQKHVVAGYQPIMPSFEGQISEDEILQLIAYIQSLQSDGDQQTPGANQ